jgi:hypothetical protein
VPRVRQDEDKPIDSRITELERKTALQGLKIGGPKLRFDTDTVSPEARHGIPCPWIAIPRQRDLGSPGRPLGQQVVEPTEKLAVALITERLTAGEGSHTQVQAHDREQDHQQSEAGVTDHPTLDLTHPGGGHARRSRHVRLAETRCLTGVTQLPPKLDQAGTRPSDAPVSMALAA